MKPTQQLHDLGQRLWLDNIDLDIDAKAFVSNYRLASRRVHGGWLEESVRAE